MKELKPKLIIADSGRRRRGSGGGFWSFLTFLIVFAVGVYIGTKLDEYGFTGGESPRVEKDRAPGETYTVKEMKKLTPVVDTPVYLGEESISGKEPAVIISEKLEYGKEALTDPTISESVPEDVGAAPGVGITSLDPEDITEPGGADGNGDTEAADSAEEEKEKVAEESGVYGYTLQIAAFASPEDAQEAADDYRSKGYNAYTVQVENSRGEKWNLVKIGKYRSIEQAWNQSALFKRREGKDAYVETLSQKTAVNESWNKKEDGDQ